MEKEIADFKHTEDAVIFNTGYMANLGVLYALAGKGDVIFSDELNHASIVDGCRISKAETAVYRHSDMADLERLLQTVPCEGQRFIVTDGVFSMDGDICPLPALAALKKDYRPVLSWMTPMPRVSLAEPAGERRSISVWQGSTCRWEPCRKLSVRKGIHRGKPGNLRLSAEYIAAFYFLHSHFRGHGSGGLSGSSLVKSGSGEISGSRLCENTAYMRNLLTETGVDIAAGDTPIIPVVVGDEKEAIATAEACRKEGILLSAIRPPSVPVGTSRIRLTVTAMHTKEEMKKAAAILIRHWRSK